jgi:hypothetical protein
MLGLAYRSWRLAFQAAGAMPDNFVSSGVAACLLLIAQAKLVEFLAAWPVASGYRSPFLLVICGGLLALTFNLARIVFVAPLSWAAHRWVLLGARWNELALPVKPGQRRLARWMAVLAVFACFAITTTGIARLWDWRGLPLAMVVPLLALGFVCVRFCLAGPAIALDVSAPLRASWDITRRHHWFIAGSFLLAVLPLSLISAIGIVAWRQHGNLLGLGLFGAFYVLWPALISTWQAGLYALLRGEATLPPPAEEPPLLLAVWQGWRLGVGAVRGTKLLLPAAIALTAIGRYLVLQYIDRQHLELGRTGSLLEDFGWSGVAWIGFVHVQSVLLSAYAGAAVVCAVLRRVFLGETTSLAALWPKRRVLAIFGLFVLLLAAPALWDAAIFVRDVVELTIGPVSTLLTELLFAAPAIAGFIAILRFSLMVVPMAQGHHLAAAESFRVSRGHVCFIAITYALAVAPPLLLVRLLVAWAPIGDLTREALVLPVGFVVAWLWGAGMMAGLYQRFFPGLAEEERPSRNATRRREPALAD